MDKLLTGNVWKQIARTARKQPRRLAAIAYVSEARYLRLKRDDVLVCDASDPVIRSGGTSATALRKYLKDGVRLYSHPNLHAKVVVFGSNVLIGSCNLSSASAERLREAALLSSRPTIRSQAVALITMARDASEEIDAAFIRRIAKIKVIRRSGPTGKRRQLREHLGNRTWIVRTFELDESRYESEKKLVERAKREVEKQLTAKDSEVGWIRWAGKSHFRNTAKEGDTIIEMNSAKRSKRITVSGPVPILKRQEGGKWTRFYYEWPEDLQEMSWTDFERKLKRVGVTSIKKAGTRDLSAHQAALVETIWEKP